MDIFFAFLVTGVAIVIGILHFDKQQTVKIKATLKETRGIPPLFLLKATEQKINSLKAALRYDDAPVNMASIASMANLYSNQDENARVSKVQELKLLSARYNNGLISLEMYNDRLEKMLDEVNELNGGLIVAC